MINHAILEPDHANSDITKHSLQQAALERLAQRIQRNGDTLSLVPCKCRNCLVCREEEYNWKVELRRRRILSRVQMANPCMITLAPEDPAHPEIGKLIGEAIARLKRSGLCTGTYVWQTEIGRQGGRLHVHAVVDATAGAAEIRAGLDAWHDNRKEPFCSKHSGISVELKSMQEAINYMFKSGAAPVDSEGWERLPHRTFGKSRDIDLKPSKQRQVPKSAKRRSPNDYAPRTWDSQDCGELVMAVTTKQGMPFVSDTAKLDLKWDTCSDMFGGDGSEEITFHGTEAPQALEYLAAYLGISDKRQSTETQPLPSPNDPGSWLDGNVPVQSA